MAKGTQYDHWNISVDLHLQIADAANQRDSVYTTLRGRTQIYLHYGSR